MSKVSKRQLETLKKVFAVVTTVTTMLSLAGFAAYPAGVSAAVPADYGLTEGNTISATGSSDPDIYIVNALGYKRLFLNPVIFSFYGHLGGFAAVKSVSATARDAFPTSGLFRNCETNDPKVYGVEVTGEDTGILHWVNTTGAQAVADDANFFKKVFCINNNEFNWYAKGANYTSVNQVPNYSRTGTTPTPTGSISVGLAADNPAAGTLVKSQAAADLVHLQFTGSGVVNTIALKRIGVSADTDLANVYLYDGVKRLTDAASVTSGMITFNDTSATGLFSVSGSKTISVKADLSSSTGETVGVQLTAVNGGAVSVTGNLFTVANATLGTVVLANSATPAANAALDPASDVVGWQDTATIGTRAASLKAIQFRVIGSVLPGDLQNFRFYIDGVQQGAAVAQTDANGYIVFDFSAAPVTMQTGGRVMKILVDVINGSGRNFTLSLRSAADIQAIDSQYNQQILPTVNTSTFPDSAGQQTISNGTLTITKTTDSPSGDVVHGASGVVLGRFTFKAAGERMKVESLRATFAAQNSAGSNIVNLDALRNGAIFANGVQIGSTQTLWEDSAAASNSAGTNYTQYSLGSSLIVTPGSPVTVEIRADIFDNSGIDATTAGNTIQASFATGGTNVQRLTSLGYVNSTAASANTMTIRTGSLSGSKYSGYANQTVVSPSNGVKIGHYTLTAASSEDVNVNTINIDLQPVGTFTAALTTNMYIQVQNDLGSIIYTSPVKSTVSSAASNSYSVNFSLPKNKTYQIMVWADVGSAISNGDTMTTNMDATGVTAASSTSTSSSQVTGQTVTVQAGSLTKQNGSLQAARLANGGSTVNGYAFTLQPAYDNFTLDEVYVDIASSSSNIISQTASTTGAVATLQLKDGNGNLLSSATINPTTGSASFTGVNFPLLQANGTKTFKVDVQLANVGAGANDTAGRVVVRFDGMKYHNSSGTVTTQNGYAPTSFAGNAIVDVAGYPVITNQALSSTVLSTGSKDIFQANVSSVGTGAALKRLVFSVTRSNVDVVIGTAGQNNLTYGTYKIFKDGTDISSFGTFATGSVDLKSGTGTAGAVAFTFTNDEGLDAGGHVYKLQVSVTSLGASPRSIVTQIANTSTTASAPDDSANATLMPAAITTSSPSVVWTDSSTVAHASTTDDYMNDYLVKTINTSQSVSY